MITFEVARLPQRQNRLLVIREKSDLNIFKASSFSRVSQKY